MRNSFRTALFLLFFFAIFAAPLFGQSRAALTRSLGNMIDERNFDIAAATLLLEKRADPNGFLTGYESGNLTFLMLAVIGGSVEFAELLLDYGADPNVRNSAGISAAHCANGPLSEEMLRLLAAKGARFDITDNRGDSPLMHHIVRAYTVGGVAFVLDWEEQHSPNFSAGFENRSDYLSDILATFLYGNRYSSIYDLTMYKLANRFIDSGASPNIRDRDGESVLYIAASVKNADLVNFLLGKGADPNQQTSSGETALMAASYRTYEGMNIKGNLETIRLLLGSGADPNIQDDKGETAMMKTGHWELAEMLLNAGADPSIKNSQGQTVLHRWHGNILNGVPMLDTLISRGCFIDDSDNEGTTLLMIAASEATRWLMRAALERGADPSLRDAAGKNALHHYMLGLEKRDYWSSRDEALVAAMIEAGARPGDTDNEGNSALSVAMRLSYRQETMIPIRDLMLQYANDDEIKAAQRITGRYRRDIDRKEAAQAIALIFGALALPLFVGGMSIGMREGVYRDNPSQNWMGSINGGLNIATCGVALSALTFFMLVKGVSSGAGESPGGDAYVG
ncbi:MAG: ankyrin repeat domain-containing protein, partial [Treponema sp.]|nr:ankyrin repeat domain-containing protein [Treponema sp.]